MKKINIQVTFTGTVEDKEATYLAWAWAAGKIKVNMPVKEIYIKKKEKNIFYDLELQSTDNFIVQSI